MNREIVDVEIWKRNYLNNHALGNNNMLGVPEYDEIDIVFENCECATISKEDIIRFEITMQSYQFGAPWIDFILEIDKNCQSTTQMGNVLVDRLLQHKDITTLYFKKQGKKEIKYWVNWPEIEDQEHGWSNPLQAAVDNGNTILVIVEGK